MACFNIFESNDDFIKSKYFDKKNGGLQAISRVVYMCQFYILYFMFSTHVFLFVYNFLNFGLKLVMIDIVSTCYFLSIF